jgi:hypothetical protein
MPRPDRDRPAEGGGVRRRATAGLSLALIVLGVVAVARTLQAGVGGGLGLVLGGMLVAAGALRLYLTTR